MFLCSDCFVTHSSIYNLSVKCKLEKNKKILILIFIYQIQGLNTNNILPHSGLKLPRRETFGINGLKRHFIYSPKPYLYSQLVFGPCKYTLLQFNACELNTMATTIPNLHSIYLSFWQNQSYTLAGLWNTDILYNRLSLSFVTDELSFVRFVCILLAML